MSLAVEPLASRSSTRETQMRWPRMHGFPKHTFGSILMRSRSCSRSIAALTRVRHDTDTRQVENRLTSEGARCVATLCCDERVALAAVLARIPANKRPRALATLETVA